MQSDRRDKRMHCPLSRWCAHLRFTDTCLQSITFVTAYSWYLLQSMYNCKYWDSQIPTHCCSRWVRLVFCIVVYSEARRWQLQKGNWIPESLFLSDETHIQEKTLKLSSCKYLKKIGVADVQLSIKGHVAASFSYTHGKHRNCLTLWTEKVVYRHLNWLPWFGHSDQINRGTDCEAAQMPK